MSSGNNGTLYNSEKRGKAKKQYPCTISQELLEAWNAKRRRGDTMPMAEKLGVSRPVIENALNYGYVVMEGLAEWITQYFADRVEREKQAAQSLNALPNK